MKNVIEKAQGAVSNSFVTVVKDCISVHPETLKGQCIDARIMFTSDEHGETLSVFDPATKKQIVMPFEQVEQLIFRTRRERVSGVGMKKVFICSRYRADEKHSIEDNVRRALYACRTAANKGCAPYAPHLYLPLCLDDSDPAERELGMAAGREFLAVCDEVWQWGATVSEGMAKELALAAELGIPVKVFNSIGIPRERWNESEDMT
jgi:hypothetical protein